MRPICWRSWNRPSAKAPVNAASAIPPCTEGPAGPILTLSGVAEDLKPMPQLPVPYRWKGAPPDPLAHPALYDGLIWRRLFAYIVDCVIIGLLLTAGWVSLTILGVLSFGLLLPVVPVLV